MRREVFPTATFLNKVAHQFKLHSYTASLTRKSCRTADDKALLMTRSKVLLSKYVSKSGSEVQLTQVALSHGLTVQKEMS